MAIQPTEAVSPNMFGMPGAEPSSSPQADKDMFLQLLVAQMRYQDPMNPTDSSAFLSQSAQFTALEKMQQVADQTAMSLSAQMAFGASALVGRSITWTDAEGATQSGVVSGVSFGAEGPVLDVAGTEVPLALVASVTSTTPSGAPSSPTA